MNVTHQRRFAAALVATLCMASPAWSQSKADAVKIDGFRSARFQMTEDQVRIAINADFKITAGKIEKLSDAATKTTIMRIMVPDLVSERGTAQVSYTLGHRSNKLIQVDVIWSPLLDSSMTKDQMLAVQANLGRYLNERGFAKNKTVVNAATERPNVVLLFRGEDDQGHVVALAGRIKVDPKAEVGKQVLGDEPEAVILTYVFNAKSPDVYRIEPGKF